MISWNSFSARMIADSSMDEANVLACATMESKNRPTDGQVSVQVLKCWIVVSNHDMPRLAHRLPDLQAELMLLILPPCLCRWHVTVASQRRGSLPSACNLPGRDAL